MTDFYGNPPKTKEDIRNYLTSWLKPIEGMTPLVIKNETFVQELGFRRAFHTHCVFRNISTNEYVWWVFELFDIELFPTTRYPTYESLLENLINYYYIAWKLKE